MPNDTQTPSTLTPPGVAPATPPPVAAPTVTTTTQSPKKSNKMLMIIVLIVGAIVLLVGGYLIGSSWAGRPLSPEEEAELNTGATAQPSQALPTVEPDLSATPEAGMEATPEATPY